MATEILSQVGSGTQQFRQGNVGLWHKPAMAAHIVNWEDQAAVTAIRTSGYPVVFAQTMLPSGVGNLAGRRAIAVYNNGGGVVYLGPTGVSATNGYPLPTGVEKVFALAANLNLYAIAASGASVDVRVMEIA